MACGQTTTWRYSSGSKFYLIIPAALSQCTTTLPVSNPRNFTFIKVDRTPLGQLPWCTGEATVELMLPNTNTTLYRAELCKNNSFQRFEISYRSTANFMLRVTTERFLSNIFILCKLYNIYYTMAVFDRGDVQYLILLFRLFKHLLVKIINKRTLQL